MLNFTVPNSSAYIVGTLPGKDLILGIYDDFTFFVRPKTTTMIHGAMIRLKSCFFLIDNG